MFESCTLFAVGTDLADRLLGIVRNDGEMTAPSNASRLTVPFEKWARWGEIRSPQAQRKASNVGRRHPVPLTRNTGRRGSASCFERNTISSMLAMLGERRHIRCCFP
jgi:hypothetical protein